MICIVLAAGYATRMYPLTENFPKPLLDVGKRPILNWLLDDVDTIPLISHIYVVSNHKFISHFKEWGREQHLSKPLTILDDGSESNEKRLGAVRDIQIALDAADSDEDALVIAGDNILTFSFEPFVSFYEKVGFSCVMCYEEPDLLRRQKTGIITIDSDGLVTSFEEKPKEPKSDLAVPPFYCYKSEDLRRTSDAIGSGCSVDAPGSLARWLSSHSKVYAWEMIGKRYDIGSLEGYRQIQSLVSL